MASGTRCGGMEHVPTLGRDEKFFSFHGTALDDLGQSSTNLFFVLVHEGTVNVSVATLKDGILDSVVHFSWFRFPGSQPTKGMVRPLDMVTRGDFAAAAMITVDMIRGDLY